MKNAISCIIAAAALASPAQAEGLFDFDPAPGGVYVSGYGGGNFVPGSFFSGVSNSVAGSPGAPVTVNIEYKTGYQYGGAAGAQLPFKYWRVFYPRLELEVSATRLRVKGGSTNGGDQIFSGDQSTTFVLLNNYSDIKWAKNQRIIPYVGGGFGLALLRSDVGYFPATATTPNDTFAVSGKDTAFASHIAGGFSAPFGESGEVYVEGRYTKIYSANLERRFVGGGADVFDARVTDSLNEFTATGGLRWRF